MIPRAPITTDWGECVASKCEGVANGMAIFSKANS